MRRGAPIRDGQGAMSIEDMEGGLSATPSPRASPSSSSHSLNTMDIGTGSSHGYGDYSSGKTKMSSRAYSRNYASVDTKKYFGILLVAVVVVSLLTSGQTRILINVYAACIFGAIASLWLSQSVLTLDDGTAEMRAVSDPIMEGADGFLRVQYTVCFHYYDTPLFEKKIKLTFYFLTLDHASL